MVADVLIGGSFVLIVLILASILGTVTRPERVWFVAGIAVFIVGHAFVTSPRTFGVVLAVVGIALAAASTVPMLTESV